MNAMLQMRVYAGLAAVVAVAGLAWVYAVPPESLRTTREGDPHFAPKVMNPETGEGIPLKTLVRHYKGG